jgi:hypothetical protein
MSFLKSIVSLFMVMVACCSFAQQPMTRLDVTAKPEGAVVFIDGKKYGVAPVRAFDLQPGRHLVRVEAPNCVPVDEFIILQESMPAQKSFSLTPEFGLVLIKTNPEGADIRVNGVSIGSSPMLVTTLIAGEKHEIELAKTGYGTKKISVLPEGRKPIVREETLSLDSGTIKCNTEPEGAMVFVNGVERGASPVEISNVAKGVVSVRVKLDGYRDEIRELRIAAGETQNLNIALKGLPAKLTIVSSPENARAFIDGDYQGKTPVTVSTLSAGEHKIRVEMPGHAPLIRDITLSNGEERTEEFSMKSTLGRLELTTIPSGVRVFIDGKSVGMTRSQGGNEKKSKVLTVEKIKSGEHSLLLRLDGYKEIQRKIAVNAEGTTPIFVSMKRIFMPDTEVETIRGTYKGVLISNDALGLTLETAPGISKTIPQSEIRKMRTLK